MVYRVVLVALFVVAVALTLNERWQEQRAHAVADQVGQPAGSIGSAPTGSIGAATSAPSAYPTMAPFRGPAALRPVVAFVPHRVRARQEVALLREPAPTSPAVEPTTRVTPGTTVEAIEERDGWYLVDTNLARGWARVELFEEP
jgi:hypothetical protein